jgi:hypothetical protein
MLPLRAAGRTCGSDHSAAAFGCSWALRWLKGARLGGGQARLVVASARVSGAGRVALRLLLPPYFIYITGYLLYFFNILCVNSFKCYCVLNKKSLYLRHHLNIEIKK